MEAIKNIIESYNSSNSSNSSNRTLMNISSKFLDILIKESESSIGFIGITRYDKEKKQKYLQWTAVSDISWDEKIQKFYTKSMSESGIKQYNLDNLFGLCLEKNDTVISNNPQTDERRGGKLKLPPGHPLIKNFLGLPFNYFNKNIGMVGLANSQKSFTEAQAKSLSPLIDKVCHFYYYYDKFNNSSIELRLETSRKRAEDANKAKNSYLSRMSHELRTPLNSILGFSQLIKTTNISASTSENIDCIIKAGKFLTSLINDVLDISKIEGDNISLSIETTSLFEIIKESLDIIEQMAEKRNISIYIQNKYETEEIYLLTDKQRLKQVIINILSNAIKYNKNNGDIKIIFNAIKETHSEFLSPTTITSPSHTSSYTPSHSSETAYMVITIIDTGVGIPADTLANLYKPFDRLGAEKTNVEGSGLGLALTKKLITKLKGKIDVQSVEGEGTSVTIHVPLDKKSSQFVDVQTSTKKQIPEFKLYGKPKKKKIIYIEDNFENYKLIKKIIYKIDKEIELIYTTQGQMGYELTCNNKPELILLDYNLPDINGDKVLKLIKDNESIKELPVYIVSANVNHKKIKELINLGAKEYITKPIDIKHIMSIIKDELNIK